MSNHHYGKLFVTAELNNQKAVKRFTTDMEFGGDSPFGEAWRLMIEPLGVQWIEQGISDCFFFGNHGHEDFEKLREYFAKKHNELGVVVYGISEGEFGTEAYFYNFTDYFWTLIY